MAASLAILLCSISALRNARLGRVVAIYGCLVAVAIIVAVTPGHLHLDVHGMAAVWFTLALRFVLAGFGLCSRGLA